MKELWRTASTTEQKKFLAYEDQKNIFILVHVRRNVLDTEVLKQRKDNTSIKEKMGILLLQSIKQWLVTHETMFPLES